VFECVAMRPTGSTATVLIRRFGLALAVSSGLILAGSARAADSTDYFGADKSGDLVRVTVTGNHAGATAVVRQGNPETQQTSPAGSDGGVIVGLVADSNAGTTKLFTYDTATQHFTDLSSLGSHIAAATIYDGGARIAYSQALKHRYVIRSAPATGGPTTTLFSSKAWKPWDVAVSESGRRVYFSATETVAFAGQPSSDTQRSNVFGVTATGKKKLERTVAQPLSYTQIELSPSGGKLAVVRQRLTGTPRTRFSVVKLSTGHVRTVLRSYANSVAGIAWAADGSSLVFRDETSWGRLSLTGQIDAITRTSKLSFPVLAVL
jgi:hypothetical protein